MNQELDRWGLQVRQDWETLLHRCRESGVEDVGLVERAYALAYEVHEPVRRKSGEPYILHPLAVAQLTLEILPGDSVAVAAALLHDVVEDSDRTVGDIRSAFGDEVARIVAGLTKISKIDAGNSNQSQQLLNYEKLIRTMQVDIRIIFIKLTDRLHNMRTLESLKPEKQEKIANETIYFYVPVAERLGLYKIKTELEVIAFRYKDPTAYQLISRSLDNQLASLNERMSSFMNEVQEVLNQAGITYKFEGRSKSISSIWRKMQSKNLRFDEVYDLLAVRIIFEPISWIDEGTQCWYIYTLLAEHYPMVKERMRNWVSAPKVNGYESLHCTIVDRKGGVIEVQIRTRRMHDQAEYGRAAHWRYKGRREIDDQGVLDSLRSLFNQQTSDAASETQDSKTFVDQVRKNVFTPHIMVKDGASGQEKYIMRGATALDFAYSLGLAVGHRALGARINGVLTMFNQVLHPNDVVEILTADSQRPSKKWLDVVKTPQARNAITADLARQEEEIISDGRLMAEMVFNALGRPFSEEHLARLCSCFEAANLNELYRDLANGWINPRMLKRRVRRYYHRQRRRRLAVRLLRVLLFPLYPFFYLYTRLTGRKPRLADGHDPDASSAAADNRGGTAGLPILQAPCCSALPGDQVLGIKNEDGTAIIAHRKSCEATMQLLAQHVEMTENIEWKPSDDKRYIAHLYLSGGDRRNLLTDIFGKITNRSSGNSLYNVNMQSDDEQFQGVISISVRGVNELTELIGQLKSIEGMQRVYRIDTSSSYGGGGE